MSLDFDISKVEWEEKWIERDGKEVMNPLTHTIIFTTMYVDMGEITEGNWQEFYTRVHAWELVVGAGASKRATKGDDEWEPYFITPEDVRRHIGLHTNVTKTSLASFKTKLWKIMEDKAKAEMKKEKVDAS